MGTILRDLFEQHRRRLYLAARQILAAHSESQVALANALQRIADRGFAGPDDQFLHFADRVLHDVIDEQRRAGSRFPAS